MRVAPPVLVGILGLGCGLGPEPAPVVHRDDGRLAFDHPGAWTVEASGGEATATWVLEGPDDALLMLFVWTPGLGAEPAHMSGFLLEMLSEDLGPIELSSGDAVDGTRTLAGEPARTRATPITLSLLGSKVPGTVELALVDTPQRTLAAMGLVYDDRRAEHAAAHALVLDSLTWSAR